MLFRGKRKSKGVGEWFYLLIKQCVHVYMHVIFVLTFCLFVVKNFYVLEFNNCVCKFDKNKNENLNKKKKTCSYTNYLWKTAHFQVKLGSEACYRDFQKKYNPVVYKQLLWNLYNLKICGRVCIFKITRIYWFAGALKTHFFTFSKNF